MIYRLDHLPTIKSILEDESINMPQYAVCNEYTYWLSNEDQDCLACSYRYIDNVFMCHIYVKKEARGKKSIKFGRDAVKWWLANTEATKLTGFTPSYLPQAYRYAKLVGFKDAGFINNSIEYEGKVYGHYITEII